MPTKTKLYLSLFLVVQIIGLQLLSYFPERVEKYYSTGLYVGISKTFRFSLGWIPFSVGDIFYSAVVILAVRWLVLNLKKIKIQPFHFLLDITSAFSVVYLLFHMSWGLNYYRNPLHETLGLEKDYTEEQLLKTTRFLIKQANQMHLNLGYADSSRVQIPYTQKEIIQKSINGYQNLSEYFPKLNYPPASVKNTGWSEMLSYMGNSGYFNPFSHEAQINALIPMIHYPVVVAHEQAHQLGFAAENEANFLGYLASIHNEDPYFKYTGTVFALRYCLNDIYRKNPDLFYEVICDLHTGIRQNMQELQEFWQNYHGVIEKLSEGFFDVFLKANNQSDGIKTYSYVVALIVNYLAINPITDSSL